MKEPSTVPKYLLRAGLIILLILVFTDKAKSAMSDAIVASEQKKSSTAGDVDADLSRDDEFLKLTEESLRKHLSRLKRQSTSTNGIWNELLRPDILSFTTNAIAQEMEKSLSGNLHSYQGRRFGGIHIFVSTIPVESSAKARTYFDRGYKKFFEVLLNDESDYRSGDVALVHWINCRGAIHLTFFPALKSKDTRKSLVLARDLLTKAEMSQLGF